MGLEDSQTQDRNKIGRITQYTHIEFKANRIEAERERLRGDKHIRMHRRFKSLCIELRVEKRIARYCFQKAVRIHKA